MPTDDSDNDKPKDHGGQERANKCDSATEPQKASPSSNARAKPGPAASGTLMCTQTRRYRTRLGAGSQEKTARSVRRQCLDAPVHRHSQTSRSSAYRPAGRPTLILECRVGDRMIQLALKTRCAAKGCLLGLRSKVRKSSGTWGKPASVNLQVHTQPVARTSTPALSVGDISVSAWNAASYPTDQAGRQQLADELTARGFKPTQGKQHFDRDKINRMVEAMEAGSPTPFDWNKASLQPIILGPQQEILGGHHRIIAAHLAGIDLTAIAGPRPQIQYMPTNYRAVSQWIDVLPDVP